MDISGMTIKKKVNPGMSANASIRPPPPPVPPSFERPANMPPLADDIKVDDAIGKRKQVPPPVATADGFKKGFFGSSGLSSSSSSPSSSRATKKEPSPKNTSGGFKKGFFDSFGSKQPSSPGSSTAEDTDNDKRKEFEYTTTDGSDGRKVDKLKNNNESGEWTINRLPDGKMEASFKPISKDSNLGNKSKKTTSSATSSSSSSSSSSSGSSGIKTEPTIRKGDKTSSRRTPDSSSNDDKKPPELTEREKEIERLQQELQDTCMKRDEYLKKRREMKIEDKIKYMERLKDFNYLKGKVHEPAWKEPDRFPASLYDRFPTRPFPNMWADGAPMSDKNFMGEDRTGKNFFVDPNEELYLQEARRDCHYWVPEHMGMKSMMIKIETLGQEQGIKELKEVLEQNEVDRGKEGFDEEEKVRELLIKWIEKTRKEFPLKIPTKEEEAKAPQIGEGFLKPNLDSDVNFKEMTVGAVNAAIQAAEIEKALYCKEAEEKMPSGDKFIWRKYGKKLFQERRKWEDAKRADPSLPSEGAYNLATRLIWASFDYTKPFDLNPPKPKQSNVDVTEDGLFRINPSINKKALPKALRDLL